MAGTSLLSSCFGLNRVALISFVDAHAAGLAALAALLAVLIGPTLQSIASVKQGRSQAIAAFTGSLTQSAINDTAQLIALVAELYAAPPDHRRPLQKRIFDCELRATLIIGTSTLARSQLVTYLALIRDGAERLVESEEMERLVQELKASFESVLLEERKNVRSGK